jgi:hypothetical protein
MASIERPYGPATKRSKWVVARHFRVVCESAGLVEVSQRLVGRVQSGGPQSSIRSERQTLLALRPALLRHGVASEAAIESVLSHLAEAESWNFAVLFPLVFVELVAQVPP